MDVIHSMIIFFDDCDLFTHVIL